MGASAGPASGSEQDLPNGYDPNPPGEDSTDASRLGGHRATRDEQGREVLQYVLRPYPYQRELVESDLPARFCFLAWGNKAGKTSSMVMRMARLLWEEENKTYRWIAPFWRQADIALTRLLKILPPRYFQFSVSKSTISRKGKNGSSLSFHSGEKPDAIPGEDVHGCVLDEASRIREAVFHNTMTTLLATRGWLCAISTPHGRNWFYQQCKLAMSGEPGYYYRNFPSYKNPLFDPETIQAYQRTWPEMIYRESIEAEFVHDAAATFPDLSLCATPQLPRNRPDAGKTYVIGVDVGQMRDQNVATVWDVFDGALVSWQVARGRDYTLIEDDLYHLSQRWNHAGILIERNGPGIGIIQHLRRRGANLLTGPDGQYGFTTTGGNKPALVHHWGMALRAQEPMLPPRAAWPALYDEHENFEYTINKSGGWSFEAAVGHHDDIVMSCLIGWWAVGTNTVRPSYWRPGSAQVSGPRDKILHKPIGSEQD